MVAAAPYLSVAATITSYVKYASTGFPVPSYNATRATTTSIVYQTITVCPCTNSLAALPTTASTCGYDNPYNYVPQLSSPWPGKPTPGEVKPSPRPNPPNPYGGDSGDEYSNPGWIPKDCGGSLIPGLPQKDTNGDSPWGLIDTPPLSGCLPVPPIASSAPPYPYHSHGSHSLSGSGSLVFPTSPSLSGTVSVPVPTSSLAFPTSTSTTFDICNTELPETGATRTYDFTIAEATIAPDGVTRNAILINGQFPGPLVHANFGDWIQVKVTNKLAEEGTSLHFHGLFQRGTPWFDGVPSVGQCPVAPGAEFTMTFRADQCGTSWYHSHYSAQYGSGAFGPVVIECERPQAYDIDIGPVMIGDAYHMDYQALVNKTLHNEIPLSQNNLINGKNNYPCQNTTLPCTPNAGLAKFRFQSGKKHLLRLINPSSEGTQKFSIDNHTLTVIANDFVPVQPYDTNVVTLGVGQRADVIVEAIGNPSDSFWMRAQLATERCTLNDGVSPNAAAGVFYEDADSDVAPTTESDVTAAQLAVCKNDELSTSEPYCSIPLVADPDYIVTLNLTFASNDTSEGATDAAFLWSVNDQTFRGNFNKPVLHQAEAGNLTFEPEWNVYNTAAKKTVRYILQNNEIFGNHPIHLHGHDFQILYEGVGIWDGTVDAKNANNPARRDTQILENRAPGGDPTQLVIQYTTDNPGVWPLHCHLAWHVSAGLYINVLEHPETLQGPGFEIPEGVRETCKSWDAFTASNTVDQIDSGL